jgi:hypothetical protein
MKTLRYFLASLLLVSLLTTLCIAQDVTWYKFDRDFINAKYSTSAIGNLSFSESHPAGSIHASKCGGKDGEIHIGMRLSEVQLPNGQMPLTDSPGSDDDDWGLVAELPNAKSGNGKSKLAELAGEPIKFFGYFRVWDEGHGAGDAPPSNPHHVFEIHPAWGFSGTGVNFMRKDLVRPMPSYKGYGLNKLKPLFQSLSDGEWPLAFRSNDTLHLGLQRFSNFFQIAAKVTSVTSVNGGHEVKVDVFSNPTTRIYSGLTTITATGTPTDGTLSVGQKITLLGFFSVNLKKALDGSSGASSEANAVHVKDAVEFFVFGRAVNPSVNSCS